VFAMGSGNEEKHAVMRRLFYILIVITFVAIPCAWWAIRQARLREYPAIARPLVSQIFSASGRGGTEEQAALVACAEGLSALSSHERADIYITLLRHRQFDASSALCFLHIALLDRAAFVERAAVYRQSPVFSSLSDSQRRYAEDMFHQVQTATYDDWAGKELPSPPGTAFLPVNRQADRPPPATPPENPAPDAAGSPTR
jgi:hypothetical protein